MFLSISVLAGASAILTPRILALTTVPTAARFRPAVRQFLLMVKPVPELAIAFLAEEASLRVQLMFLRGDFVIVGAFNDLIFEVSSFKIVTFENFHRDTKMNFAEHKIIDNPALLERLGRELETISFEMMFHAGLGIVPFDEVQKARDYCKRGETGLLIIGNHAYTENAMVITDLSETVLFWDRNAKHYVSKMKVNFKEYPEIYL